VPARTAARLRALALFHDVEAEHLRRWAQELDKEEREKVSVKGGEEGGTK